MDGLGGGGVLREKGKTPEGTISELSEMKTWLTFIQLTIFLTLHIQTLRWIKHVPLKHWYPHIKLYSVKIQKS
jgi:hypothetical protein